jgi:hypothetical protein
VAERRSDGAAICASCHALPKRVCGTCARTRRVALRATATRPDLCPTCYQAREITCSVCGNTALGRRTTADGQPMCFRCQACRRVDAALTGPDGTIPETLRPVRDAIVHADNPRSILNNFTHDKAMVMLTAIARGERPLSHDALDEHAGCYSVEHLRSLLVAAAALPARDEHLQRLQRFTTALLDTVDNPADRRLLAAFSRWHLLARLRRRTTGALTPHAAYRCRGDLTAAHRFLVFLRDRDHDPAGCTQDDIDTWFAQPTRHTVDASRGFLGWALRRRHLGAVTIPPRTPHQPKHFRTEDQRWDLARHMLHDPNAATVPDRVAACLVLLYAQPVTRIAALTTDHLQRSDDGGVQLHLDDPHADTGLLVLPELGSLLAQLPGRPPPGPARALPPGTWLFPGRRPGHPLHAQTLARRLRALGVDPRPDRNSTLLELARELPPTVLGRLLRLHPGTAARWADTAGGNWARYAAAHRRN